MKNKITYIGFIGIVLLISNNLFGNHIPNVPRVVAKCAGSDVTVIVTKDLLLSIYEHSQLIYSEWASRRTIEAGPTLYRTGYSTGPVLEGGVDLRITTKHKKIASVTGSAHLTAEIDGKMVNLLLRCSKY